MHIPGFFGDIKQLVRPATIHHLLEKHIFNQFFQKLGYEKLPGQIKADLKHLSGFKMFVKDLRFIKKSWK